jgi:hypothetical protein
MEDDLKKKKKLEYNLKKIKNGRQPKKMNERRHQFFFGKQPLTKIN